ncbi:MAG: ATP-binding protein, partial [Roseiarcus sp.]
MDDLLDRDASLVEVKELMLARTGGNPLFIEESARALIDGGAITRTGGKLALAKRIEGIRIPHTVQSILAARIDLLSPRDKTVLQTASVAGTTVGSALLFDVVSEPPPTVRRSLDRLCFAGFLGQVATPTGDEFVFKHPLILEVAYNGILKSQRTQLHRRIVAAIERIHASRLSEFAQRLAEHARQGEVWDKCARYLRLAALNAYRRSANIEATRLFEQALDALSMAQPSRENSELRVDLCFDLRNSLLLIGELRKILSYLAQAEAVASELQDERRLAKLASNMSHAYWAIGDTRRALHYGEDALRFAERLNEPSLIVPARYHVALAMSDLGQYAETNRRLQGLLGALREDQRHERFGLNAPLSVLGACYLVRSLAEAGEFETALAEGQQGLEIAEEIDESFARAMIHLALGYTGLVRGDTASAIRHFERAQELFSALGNKTMLPVVRAFLGRAHLLAGAG